MNLLLNTYNDFNKYGYTSVDLDDFKNEFKLLMLNKFSDENYNIYNFNNKYVGAIMKLKCYARGYYYYKTVIITDLKDTTLLNVVKIIPYKEYNLDNILTDKRLVECFNIEELEINKSIESTHEFNLKDNIEIVEVLNLNHEIIEKFKNISKNNNLNINLIELNKYYYYNNRNINAYKLRQILSSSYMNKNLYNYLDYFPQKTKFRLSITGQDEDGYYRDEEIYLTENNELDNYNFNIPLDYDYNIYKEKEHYYITLFNIKLELNKFLSILNNDNIDYYIEATFSLFKCINLCYDFDDIINLSSKYNINHNDIINEYIEDIKYNKTHYTNFKKSKHKKLKNGITVTVGLDGQSKIDFPQDILIYTNDFIKANKVVKELQKEIELDDSLKIPHKTKNSIIFFNNLICSKELKCSFKIIINNDKEYYIGKYNKQYNIINYSNENDISTDLPYIIMMNLNNKLYDIKDNQNLDILFKHSSNDLTFIH